MQRLDGNQTKHRCFSRNQQLHARCHAATPLARIALPDDDLIEKIDKELSKKGKAAALQAAPEPKQQDAAVII